MGAFKALSLLALPLPVFYFALIFVLTPVYPVYREGAIVVSGASSGIGRDAAVELARLGYTVFAGVRKEKDAASLKSEGIEGLRPVILDVTDPETIAATKATVSRFLEETQLPFVALINNAGISTGMLVGR